MNYLLAYKPMNMKKKIQHDDAPRNSIEGKFEEVIGYAKASDSETLNLKENQVNGVDVT